MTSNRFQRTVEEQNIRHRQTNSTETLWYFICEKYFFKCSINFHWGQRRAVDFIVVTDHYCCRIFHFEIRRWLVKLLEFTETSRWAWKDKQGQVVVHDLDRIEVDKKIIFTNFSFLISSRHELTVRKRWLWISKSRKQQNAAASILYMRVFVWLRTRNVKVTLRLFTSVRPVRMSFSIVFECISWFRRSFSNQFFQKTSIEFVEKNECNRVLGQSRGIWR